MDPQDAIDLAREAIWTGLVSRRAAGGAGHGLLIGLLQA